MIFSNRRIIYLNQTDSTNSYATKLLKQKELPEGSIVYTGFQSAGRGVNGNSWIFVPDASLAASWILYPDFLTNLDIFYLYIVSSLAIYDVLADIDPEKTKNHLKIKWPNDILFNNKKISGILIENIWNGNICRSSVVGIGLNIRSHPLLDGFASAHEIKEGTGYDLLKWVEQITLSLEKFYLILKEHKREFLVSEYLKHLWGYNQPVVFSLPHENIERQGTILGIDSVGRLLIQTENKTLSFSGKEVIFHLQ